MFPLSQSEMIVYLLLLRTVLTFVCNALVRAQISHSADTTQDQASSSTADAISQWRKESSDNGSHGKPASSDVHVLEIDRQLGVLQVQEAFSILETVDSPRSRLARFERSSGFVGTTVYYAKEAFILLFMNDSPQEDYLDPQPHEHKLSKPLGKAVKLLETAARQNNSDALFLLAEMSFYGNYSYPRDYKEAFRRYQDLSSLNGNSTAQYMLGFMYATGIGGSTERDQAKAMLYHTFAAANGNTRSEMTTAYRHHAGIGTPRNCNEASVYYKRVAEKAIAYSRSGPPGGVMISRDSYRLADEQGGVYGEGASVASSGVHANKAGPSSDQHAAFDDVLEYLDLMSRKGDLKATFSLGRLHYEGSRTMRRNLKSARAYFMIVARKYWAKDGSLLSDDAGIGKIASKAAGYIGRMFLRGEGMEQSFEKALTWFKRGIENGDSLCQYELGLMYLEGLGVRKDAVIAANYFKAAADQDFASAEIRLGQLLLDQGDLQAATRFFDMAIRHGHIEAFYHLAEMSNNGVGRERSCGLATAYYKVVAEKAEAIHSSFEEANRAYKDGDKENALVEYMMAAEQGYENGQANVAYILDEHKSILSLDKLMPWKKPPSALLRNTVLALIYWTRSAKQANIDSMVKMGDYYLGGYGAEADMEKAATCYHTASEMQQSAQALWNLGWMYENGIGVEQDFHLAKRFYDQALETNQEAYLPVKLSLLKLRMRSFWNTITYGKVNSIQSEPGESGALCSDGLNLLLVELKKDWSVGEWISNFLEDDHPHYHSADGDEGPPDSMNDAMPDGDDYYDEIDEGIIESLIIVGLAAALAFLVYYRQQRQTNHRRAVEQRGGEANAAANVAPQGQPLPGQQADGGFFPPPGDPNYGQWVAGGIGH